MKRATIGYAEYRLDIAISIHALVKRATQSGYDLFEHEEISIHALVKRATRTGKACFRDEYISIHALVKRATLNSAVL